MASAKEDEEPCEVNNRAFTNCLRSEIAALADEKDDQDKTVGHYVDTYPIQVNSIKRALQKFVPLGKSFKDAWKAAQSAITQERSLIKNGEKSKK